MNLQVTLKERNDPVRIFCDSYEVKEEALVEGGKIESWLVTSRGEKEIGRFRLEEVVGYHQIVD